MDIRGNVDTRLRKLKEGQYDAILLASAGLHRLGWEDRIAEILDPGVMVPAVGQGALGVETRTDDEAVRGLLAPLHDKETATAVAAERALLDELGGGCQVPLGAHAVVTNGALDLAAVVVSPDGRQTAKARQMGTVDHAESLGRKVAAQLLAGGAREIMAAL